MWPGDLGDSDSLAAGAETLRTLLTACVANDKLQLVRRWAREVWMLWREVPCVLAGTCRGLVHGVSQQRGGEARETFQKMPKPDAKARALSGSLLRRSGESVSSSLARPES